ncbi:MAG TPA: serine/threonine-protein kinase [Polyangiales bacterium]|nr:serine/threonine-protein kinase [Polyangiales bacterium]
MNAAKKHQLQPRRSSIGPYQLLAKIGEGGMGTVHLTKMDGPAGFNKLAVVKELRTDLLGSAAFLEMFLNEARLAARLAHPNVVHTYGADEEHGRLYLAMEYLDGQPWSRVRHVLWERGTLPHDLHVKVLAEVLSGLHYAHELRDYDGSALQVVHCDMSPQNVFVTYDGQVKLVDFGVARAVTGSERPDADMIVGKLAYIAPEQARGEEVDRRADIFAVGVMLWEALSGKRFVDEKDLKEIRRKRSTGAEPRLRDVVPDVPRALAEICDRALALDPKDRFATAAEFREALLSCLAEDYQDVDRVRLGELVSDAFGKERTKVHALIERHLKQPASLTSSIEDLVASLHPEPVEHTIKADLSELASVSRLRDDAAVAEASNSASIRLERKKGPLAIIGVAAAILLLGAWAISGRNSDSKPEVSAPAAANHAVAAPNGQIPVPPPANAPMHVATQPAAAPILAQTVPLVISATPPEAVLYMDGLPLHSNPYAASVKADGEMHLIRATGPGLQTQERVITLDRERVVQFDLTVRAVRTTLRQTRRPVSATNNAPAPAPVAAPIEAPAPKVSPRSKSNDFDADLKIENKPREIYDEDPYR